jgi:formate/nitrite transporter FocA (FNT family)
MPLGFVLAGTDPIWPTLVNLVPVTLGNIVGGGGLVALTYWFCYLRA